MPGLAAHRRVTLGSWPPVTWNPDEYRAAIDQAALRLPVKKTLHTMLQAGDGEYTTLDRATLCQLTGVRREATITEHWRRARQAGLLSSRARFNRSSVHRFTIPGQHDLDCEAPWAGFPLRPHVWTADELAWWQQQGWTESPVPPPWGDGASPF